MAHTVARQCVRKACSFRFPGPDRDDFACPKCGSPTKIARPYLEPFHEICTATGSSVLRLEIGLDNLRSALNVGSVFRTSDGAGVQHIHLFGICPPPPTPRSEKPPLERMKLFPGASIGMASKRFVISKQREPSFGHWKNPANRWIFSQFLTHRKTRK